MINGHIEQFLDTGWFSEATLYYNGYVYWLEAQTDEANITFFIDRWRAQNENNQFYHSILNQDGSLEWERVLEIQGTDLELIKKQFLESAVFEGETFWQIEKKVAWLDEGSTVEE